jgi:AraC family transcriptional regulator of arabinose operon
MPQGFDLPATFFSESGSRRLRIDAGNRSLVAIPRAHGHRPLQHPDARFKTLGINLVLRGRGRYVEPTGKVHELVPGWLFHRYPGIVHSTWFDPESDYAECFVVFDGDTGAQLVKTGLISASPLVHVGVDPVVLEEFKHLVKRVRLPETELPSAKLMLEALAFINELYDRARRNRELTVWERVVEDACLLLEHNLDERVPTEAVARQLGVSYAAFRKHFKNATGYAPADYRIRRRLESAQQALAEHSVMATAAMFGYGDAYAFSAQFKAFLGMSPRAFQRRLQHQVLVAPRPDHGTERI